MGVIYKNGVPYGGGGGGGTGAVDSVNGKTGEVVLTASDVGALPDDTSIPSKTSDLTNDSNFVADASYVHTDNNYDATAKGIVDGVTAALADKVDKVTGKGLSTNDYDNTAKGIVDGVTTALAGKVDTSSVGVASGVAELDANGKVPSSQLPSYVDDIIEGYLYEGKWYSDASHTTEITGETGKIYVELTTEKCYRWSGSAFVEISESLALGETSSTAYAGNKGKANADAIAAIKDGTTIDSFADVESALANKADTSSLATVATTGDYGDLSNTPTLGTAAAKDSTNSVTSGSTDLVESGAVYTAIDNLDEVRPIEITWADYQELTTEQKEADRYLITDYPSIEGGHIPVDPVDTTGMNIWIETV